MKRFCIIAIRTYLTTFMVLNDGGFLTYLVLADIGGCMKRAILLTIFLLSFATPLTAEAQVGPGVDIECEDSTIEINVHPEQNAPVNVKCTVTNTSGAAEDIDLDSNVDGNDFSLVLSKSSLSLDAGEEEDIIATFSASPRIEVLTEDFNITATVTTFGQIPLGQFGSTSEVGGTVKSLAYSRIDLEVSNPSTRNIDVNEEASIQFTVFNDGNRIDNLEVEVVNEDEILEAGFKFSSDPFFRATVNPGTSSDQGDIILLAPKEAATEISVNVQLRAYSKLDSSAEADEISIRVVVAPSSGGGGSIGISDLNAMSQDSVAQIGMIAGGVFGLIMLLVIISRLSKKAGKQKIAAKEARRMAKQEKKAAKKSGRQVVEDFDDEFDDIEDDFDFEDI